jgi:hypothetical protein
MKEFELKVEELEVMEQMTQPDWLTRVEGIAALIGVAITLT